MKHRYLSFFLLVFSPLLFQACAIQINQPFYSGEERNWEQQPSQDSANIKYSIFLIGDVGAPSKDPLEPSLKLLQGQMKGSDANSATLFLGDNIYSYGLTAPGSPGRKTDEERIKTQLDIYKDYQGEKYMIPGNHDWAQGIPGGLDAVIRQEEFVEKYLRDSTRVEGGNFFVPDGGCPGPFEVFLHDDVVLIALNSQWWLQEEERPYGGNNRCGVANELEVYLLLEDIISRNSGKHIMVVGHHPLYTNGTHGGNYRLLDHIFPLTLIHRYLVLPLPVIGSIYPWARRYGGISQDTAHPKYKAYINALMGIFEKYPNVVYAGGHEHSIQYFKNRNVPTIVSGSGCKTQHMKESDASGLLFGHEHKGYAKVNYYKNGEAWVEFWEPEGDGSKGKLIYRTLMYKQQGGAVAMGTPAAPHDSAGIVSRPRPDYRDSTVTIAANPDYRSSRFGRFLLGENYRKAWSTPVNMPVLDLATEKGGLKPYRVGGGKQTASLRLRNEEGREYTLRSVNKNPEQVLPEGLRETVAKDLLQDQISAQHPYGALVLPKLAQAAGVFHVNPKLVYIPADPLLGKYLDDFGNTIAILEENPDEDHQDVASLGYARNLIGTDKVLERRQEDNDNVVDEKGFARARLFDMLIGDWDRHEGQWRWVERKGDGERFFEPVPKDRDVAFFKSQGLIPYLATRKWAIRNIQNYEADVDDVIGLNLSALNNDRTFLSSVTREQWLEAAAKMQASVTDSVIEAALRDFPREVHGLTAPELAAKLKDRRALLPQMAADYYTFLSETVDVAGSDKTEHFMVQRLEDGRTEVEVRNIKKDGSTGRKVFKRTFLPEETEEIRLYGLGGDDIFDVKGQAARAIRVRIIGGDGRDSITDASAVSAGRKSTLVYDTKVNTLLAAGPETKDKTEDFVEVNQYDRNTFKIPYLGPRLAFEYNIDDRLYIGGGLVYRRYNFRKQPFSAEHKLVGNYAFSTKAYNLRYTGTYTDILKSWDLQLKASINGPQLLFNYFGLGNDTQAQEENVLDYRVRFERYIVSPMMVEELFHFVKIGIGPSYDQFHVVRDQSGSFVQSEIGETEPSSFRTNKYLGARAFMNVEAMDTPVNPHIGIKWLNEVSFNHQLGHEQLHFTRLASELIFYLSPNFPFQLTWAGRIGGAHNFGDFRFYQANTLGGTTNLRGYRITRYAGRSSVYANFEARLKLSDFNIYLFPGSVGLLGLIDHGRVFSDNDTNRRLFSGLHRGVGGGIWVDVARKALVSTTYSIGDKEQLFNVSFGFLY
ncbi:MAG: metallophosphoesterase [Adhaeribacter sp.]